MNSLKGHLCSRFLLAIRGGFFLLLAHAGQAVVRRDAHLIHYSEKSAVAPGRGVQRRGSRPCSCRGAVSWVLGLLGCSLREVWKCLITAFCTPDTSTRKGTGSCSDTLLSYCAVRLVRPAGCGLEWLISDFGSMVVSGL